MAALSISRKSRRDARRAAAAAAFVLYARRARASEKRALALLKTVDSGVLEQELGAAEKARTSSTRP